MESKGRGKRNNLVGQKFGKLTVISLNEEKSKSAGHSYWNCECDCGSEIIKVVDGSELLKGNTRSCGCLRRLEPANFKDLTGMKFGEWTVIERRPNRGKNVYWLCSCSCGKTIKEVKGNSLKTGESISCGHCNATEIHVGDKFGTWTVLSYEGTNKYDVKEYRCVCDCGQTTKKVQYGNLVYGNYPKCAKCRQREIESVHATVLKQIWKHYRPNVVWEDASCVNPNTNKKLDTDIVDHEWKMSVEVQSQYHDQEYQKERDIIKKNYWENHGYKHYQVDIRNYSVLEMVQVFFPEVIEIPDWVDKSGKITNRKWSYEEAQKWLDEGLNANQVAEKVGTTKFAIHGAISIGKLIRPKKEKKVKTKIREAKIPIVQLDINGEYVSTYESSYQASQILHMDSSAITKCCRKRLNTYKKFRWMYLSDYEQIKHNVI